jgi:hypothetical protein
MILKPNSPSACIVKLYQTEFDSTVVAPPPPPYKQPELPAPGKSSSPRPSTTPV